jgi:hypothetical protein
VEAFADFSKRLIDEMKDFMRTNAAVKTALKAGDNKLVKKLLAEHAEELTKTGGKLDIGKAVNDIFAL